MRNNQPLEYLVCVLGKWSAPQSSCSLWWSPSCVTEAEGPSAGLWFGCKKESGAKRMVTSQVSGKSLGRPPNVGSCLHAGKN